ncbi:MAG: hypothetical protein LBD58_12860 [Treponema sp.]|jgi:hypothetical protein|nr:hypothetical protein [Treponema sp.]
MAHSDWIPTREQDLVDLCQKWKLELENSSKIAAYGWDQTEVTEVLGRIGAFLTSRTAYEADNSTAKRLAKEEAKEEAVDAMRDFANSSIRFNKKMDDPTKLIMGIHPKDTTPTTHGTPTSQPDTVVENTVNHFEHRVRALNHETGDVSKPADAYGVRYVWQVGGERPASGADIRGQTKFSRKTNLVVTHTEADKAKTCYYATCYENGKGEQGSWSPVEEAVIG